jgi:hypothetical protein
MVLGVVRRLAVAATTVSLLACGGRSVLDSTDLGQADAGEGTGTQSSDASLIDGGGTKGDGTGGPIFPIGVYDHCDVTTMAITLPQPGGGGGGFAQDDATITLTQTGSVITATDQPTGPRGILAGGFALDFVATTSASAILAPSDQPFVQFSGVVSNCDVTALSAGSLTYDASSLYLSIVGQVTNDAGAGCAVSATFVCSKE